jgi:hypothetical protein
VTQALCRVCSTPLPGAGVTCRPCIDLLLDDVRVLLGWRQHDGRRITGLLDDLVITATRQDRMPRLGTHRDLCEERTLDHRFPGTAALTATPGRLDALALRRKVLAYLGRIQAGIRELGAARLQQHRHADEWVRTVSGQGGYRLLVERLVDRPGGAFRVPCPTCGRRVPMDADQDITRCRCGEWGDLVWWQRHVAPEVPDDQAAITGRDAVLWLLVRHGLEVTEQQLRQWATRGQVARCGRDEHGRTLYDAAQLLARARRSRAAAVAADVRTAAA